MKRSTADMIIKVTRWFARIVGLFLFLFFVWFAFAIGGPDFNLMTRQEISLFGANIIMLLGLLLAWRWEFIGSFFLIGGFISFSVINNAFWIGPLFPTFLLVGVLHLSCWAATHYHCISLNTLGFGCFLK